MQVFDTIDNIRAYVSAARQSGQTVGLVPTMGALHEGHLALIRQAKKTCDVVITSIFVNPTQFGPQEDLSNYPRQMEEDCRLAGQAGADAIFHPSAIQMYPAGFATYVNVEDITEKLCGLSRPGHFRGVATVVAKLFNIVKPDTAFFGQKDAQQVLVINRVVKDLNMDIKIITVPTVRDADGLALSSRNSYLSEPERAQARALSRSLRKVEQAVKGGIRDAELIRQMVIDEIGAESLLNIDYVELYSYPDLQKIKVLSDKALLALAVKIGRTRLIDNIILEV